ncbi:MAG: polymer-forming cytoskeletal protein [Chloroflexota bacterium]
MLELAAVALVGGFAAGRREMQRLVFRDTKKGHKETDGRSGPDGELHERREGNVMDKQDKQKDWSPVAAGPAQELNALLGRGSEFDGKLAFEGTVRIDGMFSGEITTNDTLIVGEGAKIAAEISCGTIVVHGEITGNIHAAQAVELHKPAKVKGDITSPSLMVERGVVFEGRSKMEDLGTNVIPLMAGGGAQAD